MGNTIKIEQNQSEAYFYKGCELKAFGQYEEAINCYNQAIKLKLDYADAYNSKAIALNALGQYQEAIDCYNYTIKLKPKDSNAYYNKAIALDDIGKNQEAIDCYNQAIKLEPDEADFYYGKGISLNKIGKNEEAIDCYNFAIKIKPNFANFYNGKGAALDDIGKKQEAIDCYSQAINLKPESCLFYCSRGKAYQYINNNDKAISDFKKAKSLFEQGKLEWLSSGNITYIKDTLSQVIKLLDVAAEIQSKFTGISHEANLIVREEAEELKQDVQKAVTNLTQNFDINQKEINKDNKRNFEETDLIIERIRQLEAKIYALEKKNNQLEEQLLEKQDNHLKILELKLNKLQLNSKDQDKLINYFKEFSNQLEQNYIAALAISTGKVAIKNDYLLVTEILSEMHLIGPVFKALAHLYKERAIHQIKPMSNIAHNVSAFNDLIGAASIEITLQKRQDILAVEKQNVSGFVKFLQKTKGWVDEKFLGKIKDAPTHLQPVIELAAKDATMLVAACLLGKITSRSDDANYTATKEQFIDLVVLDTKFKQEFEDALKQ